MGSDKYPVGRRAERQEFVFSWKPKLQEDSGAGGFCSISIYLTAFFI